MPCTHCPQMSKKAKLSCHLFSLTALVGTLKAAKRKKIVNYSGELLLQGVHDNVDIVLLKDEE